MAFAPGWPRGARSDGEHRRVRALRRARASSRRSATLRRGGRRGAGRGARRARSRTSTGTTFHVPIDVGPLRVRPPVGAGRATGALDVVIEPGQAFGTGSHATTRLSLELLVELAAGRRDRGLGLRERRARDRRREARLVAGAGVRHRGRVRRGGGQVAAGETACRSRSRAATCARAARRRRPCSRTSSGRCCWRSPALDRVAERLIISRRRAARGGRGPAGVRRRT